MDARFAAWPVLQHRYAQALPDAVVDTQPRVASRPQVQFLNTALASDLGLALDGPPQAWAEVFAGTVLPPSARPVAQAYAGHQFGGFSPQLGDGRALLWGELQDRQGRWHDLAFKGSGRTVFSRGGDGLAAVGPMWREVLMGEAMHALGIPSTRALALVATGDEVWRDRALPGAVLTRVAHSHLRVGMAQWFAARGDVDGLGRWARHAMARHDPEALQQPQPLRAWVEAVVKRQVSLVAAWLAVGFVHGVMNTDNMALSGQTIDYGPCAFMEAYHPDTCFSSIDRQRRYAFGQQAVVAQWNLARFVEALWPLFEGDEDDTLAWAQALLEGVVPRIEAERVQLWLGKLGLRGRWCTPASPATAEELALCDDWAQLMQAGEVDHTWAWRSLLGEVHDPQHLEPGFEALWPSPALRDRALAWRQQWQAAWTRAPRDHEPTAEERAQAMSRWSPAVIPRNHRMEAVVQAAEAGDPGPALAWLEVLRRPFDAEAPLADRLPADRGWARGFRTFCGT